MNNLIKNRIQKQLLNFDQDIEFDKSNSIKKTVEKTVEKEKWILKNTVDLGLPSGTLWMKNNLGATCDNTPKSWYGNFYAWGELESKTNYKEDTYTYKDSPNILPSDHDVVFQKTNGICYMPTKEQLEELINKSKHKWIKNYNNVKGLNGQIFIGSNGNTLFIPAAGYYYGSSVYSQGSSCSLWSSSVHQSIADYAYYLYFNSGYFGVGSYYRCYGLSVRGVL